MAKMTERKTHLDGIAVSLLVVCCLFWGAQQVLIKAFGRTATLLPSQFAFYWRDSFAHVVVQMAQYPAVGA
jgi:hypothetical protein